MSCFWAREMKVGNLSSALVCKATDVNEVMGKAAGREAECQGTKPTFLVWTDELESVKKAVIPNIFILNNKEWKMVPTILGKSHSPPDTLHFLWGHFHSVLAHSYQVT